MRIFFLLTLPVLLLAADHRISFGPEVYHWIHTEGSGTTYGGYASYESLAPWTVYTALVGDIGESEDVFFYDAELRYGLVMDFHKRVCFIPYFAAGFKGRRFEDLFYYALGTKGTFLMCSTELGFDVRGMKVASDLNVLRSVEDGKWSLEVNGRLRQYITSFFSFSLVALYREYGYDGKIRHVLKKNEQISVRAREYGGRFELALDF